MRGRFRFSSVCCALLFVATQSTADQPKDSLDIYVVRGDAAELARFQSEVGKDWLGGKFLEPLSSKTEYRYWAFPTRTAPQARTFIFGTMNHGLRLGFETYKEATYYPKERAQLDDIISRCRLKSDPFFIEPDHIMLVKLQTQKGSEASDCIRGELDRSKLEQEMPIKFIGTEDSSERG